MTKSFNSDQKIFIRENWNKPLLKFLNKRLEEKLIYMGLPSSSAEDIHHWIDHIKAVIAFQCRVYNQASDSSQGREEIENLEALLRQLEREKKLDNFVVYDGYLEEVILRGFDNSPNSIGFSQNNFITLYNLDFCNDIASPIEFLDKNGDLRTAYKFDAVKRLLEIQNSLAKVSNKFIFMLTVHCSYNGKELQSFINNPPNSQVKGYLEKYFKLSGHEKNARIVRLFVAYLIHQSFLHNNFTPKILPVVMYDGLLGTPLLHFVVLGYASASAGGTTPVYQPLNEFLDQQFVKIENELFISAASTVNEEIGVELNPINCLVNSATYKKAWA